MPHDLTLKTMNSVHRCILKISGGRVGWRASNMPVLELTTTGRRTGRPHTVMLTSPIQDGTALVLVASRGGDDRSPVWFLNLRDHPEVLVHPCSHGVLVEGPSPQGSPEDGAEGHADGGQTRGTPEVHANQAAPEGVV